MQFVVFDTETTGLPKRWDVSYKEVDNWPRVVQIAWQTHDEWGNLTDSKDYLIKPNGFDIPFDAEKVHGISTALAEAEGYDLEKVLEEFKAVLEQSDYLVGQNLNFDIQVLGAEFVRLHWETKLHSTPVLDTCTEKTANLCKIAGGKGGRFKLPKLGELHQYLFGVDFAEAHNASADVEATSRCFFELLRVGNYTSEELKVGFEYIRDYQIKHSKPIESFGLKHRNLKEESKKYAQNNSSSLDAASIQINKEKLKNLSFAHLHNHSQFSILQSTSQIKDIVKKAIEFKLSAVALTDSGNMMGAFNFVKAVLAHNKTLADNPEAQKLIPIVGCEFNVCKNRLDKTTKDNGNQVVILAKNYNGYKNLAKICSQAWIDGFYYIPRVDKKLILEHKEDLIILSGGEFGEISNLILNFGENQAETEILWWKEHFGDDFYIEINRLKTSNQERLNEPLIRLANKHNIKIVAANNNFYVDQKDADVHDILLCVKDGELKNTPIGRGRGFRFGLENQEYYFKSPEEMKDLFVDLPEAIENIQEIVNKIEVYKLESDVLLPKFDIPEQFIDARDEEDGLKRGENAFLRHLTYEGAKERYGEITDEIKERLDFELEVIAKTGYPGYFLIVQDFIAAARKMGVSVGPGRGSAAGSAVAYCTKITNIDPIKYDLLFERFLNPDRVSMPDIDIDFDDEGRGKVIQYVIDKYGASQVAQIITYGTMAAKSSIRDTARVLDLPLSEADRLAKLVPDTIKLNDLFSWDEKKFKEKVKPEQIPLAQELKTLFQQNNLQGDIIRKAHSLEGSMRNTGIHACGVIITPSDIREHIPVAVAKDSDMWCTQFDNAVVESAGLLKMDFLGLKTLTLIKDAIAIIKERHGIDLVADDFPLDDEKTYELFQRGDTVGVFQYESVGMQKYMTQLKPTVFADLIAMNALYRPGPLEYIPSFIARKHGKEPITYDLEGMDEYLEETYGITVYQEQVMLLSQKLAGFTKGEADMLRKAMGKKLADLLAKLKPKFIEGGEKNGHNVAKLEKVWKDWEAFAAYAFNKSHSTCYAYVAYQTAYLKAHYPAEYMASVLSNNMSDIKQVSFFMEECRRMGVQVLGPDVNESGFKFTVNKKGDIRFGLGAVKGVGEGAVESIIEERKKDGPYPDIYDFAKRVNLRAVNKRCFENLAKAGGFDCFQDIHRAQYFYKVNERDLTPLEIAMKYGTQLQTEANSMQQTLFGDTMETQMPKPVFPTCERWSSVYELKLEKEMVGIHISGHPLDDFELEINNFCNVNLEMIKKSPEQMIDKEISFVGRVARAEERTSQAGNMYGKLVLEDYYDTFDVMLFGDNYINYRKYLIEESFLFIKGKFEYKKWSKTDFNFNPTHIEYLPDMRKKLVKKIVLKLDFTELDEILVDALSDVILKNPGDCTLRCSVFHDGDFLDLSSDYKVDLSNDFIKSIKQLPGADLFIPKN
jgi:DNA polymerase-3 subunit alpha